MLKPPPPPPTPLFLHKTCMLAQVIACQQWHPLWCPMFVVQTSHHPPPQKKHTHTHMIYLSQKNTCVLSSLYSQLLYHLGCTYLNRHLEWDIFLTISVVSYPKSRLIGGLDHLIRDQAPRLTMTGCLCFGSRDFTLIVIPILQIVIVSLIFQIVSCVFISPIGQTIAEPHRHCYLPVLLMHRGP